MNSIKRLKKIVNVDIPYIEPRHLHKLASNYMDSDKFPDIQSSFEFPPKPMDTVLKLLLAKKYDKLNFFDIARLLKLIELDSQQINISDKNQFSKLLQELFSHSEKYIQNLILKIMTKVFITDREHSLKDALLLNLISNEFSFVKLCISKNYSFIEKSIKNQSLKKVLKYYTIDKFFTDLKIEYSNYLLKALDTVYLNSENASKYTNNLLLEDDLDHLYSQVDKLILFIEKKNNIKNNTYIDKLLLEKLGSIEDENAKWNSLDIPADLKERYKRLKGVFEFQRFVDIAKFLADYPEVNLRSKNISANGKTNDATRLLNRSVFWSNYDERFSSVKMWVSEEDYKYMHIEKPVSLAGIKQLKNINNEVCMLEFKDVDLLILEFFRLREGRMTFNSLIFEGNIISEVKYLLDNNEFSIDLYEELKILANYSIKHKFLWQGWVDEFLRNKNIYPNTSILNGRQFNSGRKMIYKKATGLEATREDARRQDISFEDIISRK